MAASRIIIVVACLLAGPFLHVAAHADVFNMPAGLTSLETVPVENPGNDADTRYLQGSFGSVSYAYNIGKYEVTAGQYCEFLNAIAATDTYKLYNVGGMWADDARSSAPACRAATRTVWRRIAPTAP